MESRSYMFSTAKKRSTLLQSKGSRRKIPLPHACVSPRNNAPMSITATWIVLLPTLPTPMSASPQDKPSLFVEGPGSRKPTPTPTMIIDTQPNTQSQHTLILLTLISKQPHHPKQYTQTTDAHLYLIIKLFFRNMSNNVMPQQQGEGDNLSTLPSPSEEEVQQLIISIKNGYRSIVCRQISRTRQLLQQFKHNITNCLSPEHQQPPLYFACTHTDEEVSLQLVEMLVQAGANPNHKDFHEQTVMFYVCRDGKKKVAQYLLQCGGSLQDEDLHGQTPVFYAATENRVQILDLFTTEMLSHVDKLAKQTPLFYAARKGHLATCKVLIERGCDPTHQDQQKKTALEFAKKARFPAVIEYLSQQIKRVKELNRDKSQSLMHSSELPEPKRKKKESQAVNNTKSIYKITLMNDDGSTHDLTDEEVKDLISKSPELRQYLMNPEVIPQQIIESTLEENWQKLAMKILNICWKVKGAFWFHEPVNMVKYNITDYLDIVKTPMDFGTIKKRLSHNFYSKADQFVSDMRLVWGNAYAYNGKQHQVSRLATEIQNLFEDSVKTLGLTKFLTNL